MKILPYTQLQIDSILDKDEFINRFYTFAEVNNFDSNQWYNNIAKKNLKKYMAEVNGNVFRMVPLVRYSRTPYTSIKGVVQDEKDHQVINITMSFPKMVSIVFIIICIVGYFVLGVDYMLNNIIESLSMAGKHPIILAFPVGIYFFLLLGFNYQSKVFIKRFRKHFNVE